MAAAMNLTAVLDHLDDKAGGQTITIDQIIQSFEERGYGPLLLSLALLELLPTGAIPGVPTLVAILVVLIAGQLLLGRTRPWVPGKLGAKGFSHEKFKAGREKLRPFTSKCDRFIKPRFPMLTTGLMNRLVAGICIVLALSLPPLELIPFASSAPAFAIALLAMGLSAKDGLFVLLGMLAALSAFGFAAYLLLM